MLQANLGLWQILARQGQIPDAKMNESWQKILNAFSALKTSDQVYQAGRTALAELLSASTGKTYLPQDQIFALLAGPEQYTKEGQQLRSEMANRMHQVIDDQRLVSLDTLISLGDGLDQMAKGKEIADSLLPLAGELREFEMPKPLFTKSERTEFAAGLYSNRHTALQMRTDLIKIIKSPASPAELAEAHALLTPFLRDTLVGLNYAYYEPPGAQMLHNNPLFVRSHDFSGGDYSGEAATACDQVLALSALFWPRLDGQRRRAPYRLHGRFALCPGESGAGFHRAQNVQSLSGTIWCPGLMTSALLPRWWSVTRNELHAVRPVSTQRARRFSRPPPRMKNTRIRRHDPLRPDCLPQRLEQFETALRTGREDDALALIAPAETSTLPAEFRRRPAPRNRIGGRPETNWTICWPVTRRRPIGNASDVLASLIPPWH